MRLKGGAWRLGLEIGLATLQFRSGATCEGTPNLEQRWARLLRRADQVLDLQKRLNRALQVLDPLKGLGQGGLGMRACKSTEGHFPKAR